MIEKILEISNPMLLGVGIIYMIMGFIMYKFPPKKINGLYGYRTASSMQNQEKWNLAQKYGATTMFKVGIFFLIISFYKFFFNTNENTDLAIGMFIMIVGSFVMIPIVEKKLK